MKIDVMVYGVPRENDVVVIDFHFFFLAVARNFAKPNDVQETLARRSANRANYQSIASIARAQLVRGEDSKTNCRIRNRVQRQWKETSLRSLMRKANGEKTGTRN